MPMHVGSTSHYLKTLRVRSGLSQQEVAALAGYTDQYVRKIENALVPPSWQALLRLLYIYGATPREAGEALFADIEKEKGNIKGSRPKRAVHVDVLALERENA